MQALEVFFIYSTEFTDGRFAFCFVLDLTNSRRHQVRMHLEQQLHCMYLVHQH